MSAVADKEDTNMEVSCKELRHRGWLLLGKNNFWQNFGVSAIAGVIGGWAGFLCYGPAEVGKDGYFVELQRGNNPTFASMFDGFKRYGVTMAAGLLQMLFSALWGILFIIPGIVYSCGRAITFYVMHDNPELSPMEALDRSRELMQGYRGKYFRLILSFIGWALLVPFTFGVGAYFLTAYVDATVAEFYAEILKEKGLEPKAEYQSAEEVFQAEVTDEQ